MKVEFLTTLTEGGSVVASVTHADTIAMGAVACAPTGASGNFGETDGVCRSGEWSMR